jgi:undecaprenyl-diphosphatase
MDPFQAIALGIVQGLTEFLPVSSSGHLVLLQHWFGLREPELAFDISVHVGTLAAVVVFFRRDIGAIIAALWGFLKRLVLDGRATWSEITVEDDLRMAWLIAAASVPTALIGIGFHEIADRLFGSVALVGLALLVTCLLLVATRRAAVRRHTMAEFSLAAALTIGVIQGVAIIPGISRSGATIALGLILGLSRDTAARFSFLLSIPAICGAALIGAGELASGGGPPPATVALGTAVSALVGYAALWMLVYIVRRGRLHLFAPYCALVGILALARA